MTYDAMDIARYIVKEYHEKKNPVTNLKLQKLLYYAWVEYFRATGERLFNNRIEAWKFGPVVPDVYYHYYTYAAIPIRERTEPHEQLDRKAKDVLNKLIDDNVSRSARELVEKTHMAGTPWKLTYESGKEKEISFDLIERVECNVC